MEYPIESFTPGEQARLRPYFSNLDRPVFALRNLPETVKGALFARYSRYQGTLRRLFLDEFADSLPDWRMDVNTSEGERAASLYERVLVGYGDDSVAQLGGAHVACEWVSNLLTKILQRPRLAAYLEQSTRYIPYDTPMPGGKFRFYHGDELGASYEAGMERLFQSYGRLLAEMKSWYDAEFPRTTAESSRAHARAVQAKALDTVRGLLPASALSHMGIYASGQSYEQLILHLLANPLPEAQRFGQWILEAVQEVVPSFVARVERPERGVEWIDYLRERREWEERATDDLSLHDSAEAGPTVRLLRAHGSEDDLLAALLFEAASLSELAIRDSLNRLPPRERARMIAEATGDRRNRRHRPARGFEAIRYRFEIVSDYGAFRDLQRHRMLTAQWQRLSPHLGAEVPADIDAAGHRQDFEEALAVSRQAHDAIAAAGRPELAPYALSLAYRIRYVLDLDAREAMHVIELRSGVQGHPSYRAVAQEMHRLISEVHPAVAGAMQFLDGSTEPRLERLLAEMRHDRRTAAKDA